MCFSRVNGRLLLASLRSQLLPEIAVIRVGDQRADDNAIDVKIGTD